MSVDADHLATRLRQAISPALGGGEEAMDWLWAALLRELAHGRPVTVVDLARATGRTTTEVKAGLGGLPDTEYDEHGAVIGHGITLCPTPHEFTVEGRRLYTWCALDTLIFPAVLDRPAQVVSPTPGTGQPVRLSVEPSVGITALDPSTAVVSVLDPAAGPGCGVRAAFCNQVHYFATSVDAQAWLAEHPAGTVLCAADAFELARRLAQGLTGQTPSAPSARPTAPNQAGP